MKYFFLVFLTIGILSTISCKDKECEKDGTGNINIENLSGIQVEVTINSDPSFLMEPNEEITIEVAAGEYQVTAVRQNSLMISTGFSPTVEVCGEANLLIGL